MSETDKTTDAAEAREQPTDAAETRESPAVTDSETSDPQALQAALNEARAKADEHWQLYLSARADIDNIRRRAERDLANAHKFALEKFVNELLPVKDSLEMGLAAANEQSDVAKLKEGKELTLKMLSAALGKFGVQEIDPRGDKFNPELHEAMAMQPSAEVAPNTVLQVVQKGYLLNERLVRPAMVVVAKAAENSASRS